MDSEILKLIGQYGIGFVLAYLILMFYRQDRKEAEARYEKLALEFKDIVQNNTEALTRLGLWVEQKFCAKEDCPVRVKENGTHN